MREHEKPASGGANVGRLGGMEAFIYEVFDATARAGQDLPSPAELGRLIRERWPGSSYDANPNRRWSYYVCRWRARRRA